MLLAGLRDTQMIAIVCGGICFLLLLHNLSVRLWGEKKSKEPEKTIVATVVSKEVKRGTQGTGRSKGGYSYAVTFLTEDGTKLELYAYELEFGGLKEAAKGTLTYRGRYFVCFEEKM